MQLGLSFHARVNRNPQHPQHVLVVSVASGQDERIGETNPLFVHRRKGIESLQR